MPDLQRRTTSIGHAVGCWWPNDGRPNCYESTEATIPALGELMRNLVDDGEPVHQSITATRYMNPVAIGT